MISLEMARALHVAGLVWTPRRHDFFSVDSPALRDDTFVLSDVMTYIEQRSGQMLITFHGALEWALDYVLVEEAYWRLTESQVREQVQRRLRQHGPEFTLSLEYSLDGYRCIIQRDESEPMAWDALTASDAYGRALLHLLAET